MKRSISDKLYRDLERELGPLAVSRLLSELANDGNAFRLAEKFSVTLWTIRLLRLEPNAAVRYLLQKQEQNQREYQESERYPPGREKGQYLFHIGNESQHLPCYWTHAVKE